MAAKSVIHDRLRARWAKQGGGPEMEARLRAAKEELARREKVARARASGTSLPESMLTPTRDPATVAATDAGADASTPPKTPQISVDAIMEEAREEIAKRVERARTEGVREGDPRLIHPDDDDEELKALEAGCVVVGGEKTRVLTPPETIDPAHPIARLKDDANAALRRGEYELAKALYDEALKNSSSSAHPDPRSRLSEKTALGLLPADLAGVLLSNRSKARLLLDEPEIELACADAVAACALCPNWAKPRARLAEARDRFPRDPARALEGAYALAMKACREGEAIAARCGDKSRPFEKLIDEIALKAARDGSVAGFDGRYIYVRSAGEEAWLGKRAPENPAFDADDDGDRDRPRPDDPKAPIHARSIAEAMDACEDGDVVLLLRGIHNGLGQACLVDKRILIRGEGALKEATVDCRSNVPLFRVTRPCVIQNVDVDFTGFSQAIHVEGGDAVDALIENCRIKASGDDGICVDGSARPTFRNCDVTGKKSALRTMGNARAELVDCKLHCCETSGVKTFGESRATLRDCHIENCQHEGVVAMQRSTVHMENCVVVDNKGPGVDASDDARVVLVDVVVDDNVGGVWLWDHASCDVRGGVVRGGASHAVLADEETTPRFGRGARIEGVVEATARAREDVAPGRDGTVALTHPAKPTSLPPDSGCFAFEYTMFDRKQ